MNAFLILIISLTTILAIYWILIGQWKHNAMLRQQKRKVKAVLFDLDGVIIDSHDAWFRIFNQTRKKFKLPEISAKEFDESVWGGSVENDAKRYFKDVGEEELGRIYKNDFLGAKDNVKINPYAHFALKNLKEKGIKAGIVTNSYKKIANGILEHHGIKDSFDVIITGNDVENGKPAPDSILKACKILGIKPEEALYVGDTKIDIAAGKNAGSFTIGFNVDGDLKISNLKDIVRLF